MGVTQTTGTQIKDGTVGVVDMSATGTPSSTTFLRGDNTWSVSMGITRVISNISTTTTGAAVANTDYVYLTTGTFTFTLPTAISNTNRYTLKNAGSGIITMVFTLGQTGDGSTTITVRANTSIDLISNGSNWFVI